MFLQISQKMSVHAVAAVFRAKCITSAPSDLVPLLSSSRRPFFHSLMKNPGVILERNITMGSGNLCKAYSVNCKILSKLCGLGAAGNRESGRLLSRKVTSWNTRENSGQYAKDKLNQVKARIEG